MKTKIKKALLFSMTAIAAGLFFAGCMSSSTDTDDASAANIIRVMQIDELMFPRDLEFAGVVQAYEEAHIGPAVPARIEKILVDVGDHVSKGQLLVQMDRSSLFQARVQLETLKADLQRLDTLLQVGAVTRQSYDQVKAQYDIAVSSIETLSTNTEIRATIPGVITGRYHSDGEIFSMTPSPAGKPAILSVMQIRPVKIIIGVSERYYNDVTAGQEATVTTDIFPGRLFSGRVRRIYPTIDRMSGTFKVEILIDNAGMSLRPGMFTRVSLNLGEQQGLLVPSLAVLKQMGSNERFVFVVENGQAVRKTVTPGRIIDDKLEILQGLRAGEILVISGQYNLMHQADVEIVP